ncbi:MAG: hypothetical protein ACYC05_13185 [Sulfuricella sp.]
MREHHGMLKQITKLGFLLMMGVSMSADAGLFGFGGTSWKEEVLLHDGSKIIVKRSQSYGGRHEVGQSSPIKEHTITFTLPDSGKTLSWTSEYGEDLGRTNFNLLALHFLNGTPYLVVEPNLCLSYNKWGRPNPPYVFFKYNGKEWQRIPLSEFPAAFKTINLIVNNGREEDIERLASKLGHVSAEEVRKINSSLTQPEYKTILREAVKYEGPEGCPEMVFYKGAWVGLGDSIGKRMMDRRNAK